MHALRRTAGLLVAAIGPALVTSAAATNGPLDPEGRLIGHPGGALRAQEPPDRTLSAPAAGGGRLAFRAQAESVLVQAAVVDRRGRPVLNLEQKDFRLLEDGQEQALDYFAAARDAPIRIALLLDVSGSMRLGNKLETAKEAMRYLLGGLGPRDSAALVAFADRQVAVLADFSADPAPALRYLNAVRAYGQTALHDAIAATPELVGQAQGGRAAILLVTDGVDNYSSVSLDQAIDAALLVDIPVYAIGFASWSRETDRHGAMNNPASLALRRVAAGTGGLFFLIHDPDEMKEAIRELEEDLRRLYVLGYAPARAARDGRFRRIELIAADGKYQVRTRRGYFPRL